MISDVLFAPTTKDTKVHAQECCLMCFLNVTPHIVYKYAHCKGTQQHTFTPKPKCTNSCPEKLPSSKSSFPTLPSPCPHSVQILFNFPDQVAKAGESGSNISASFGSSNGTSRALRAPLLVVPDILSTWTTLRRGSVNDHIGFRAPV